MAKNLFSKTARRAVGKAFANSRSTPSGDGVVDAPPTGRPAKASAGILEAFNLGQDPLTSGDNPVNAARAREKRRRQAMRSLSGSFATRPEAF